MQANGLPALMLPGSGLPSPGPMVPAHPGALALMRAHARTGVCGRAAIRPGAAHENTKNEPEMSQSGKGEML